jgi:hypothetical protein
MGKRKPSRSDVVFNRTVKYNGREQGSFCNTCVVFPAVGGNADHFLICS